MTKNVGLVNQRMQIFAYGPKRILLRRLSLGPAEVRHQNSFRAVFSQVVDGRQTFADSRVISDTNFATANFRRHVEIYPDQHAFSADVEITESEFHWSIGVMEWCRREYYYSITPDFMTPIIQPAFPSTPRSDCCSPTHYHTSRPLLRNDCRASALACYRICRSADCQRCPGKRAAHR